MLSIICPTIKVTRFSEVQTSFLRHRTLRIPFSCCKSMSFDVTVTMGPKLHCLFEKMVPTKLTHGLTSSFLQFWIIDLVDTQLRPGMQPFLQDLVFWRQSFKQLVDGLLKLGRFTLGRILQLGQCYSLPQYECSTIVGIHTIRLLALHLFHTTSPTHINITLFFSLSTLLPIHFGVHLCGPPFWATSHLIHAAEVIVKTGSRGKEAFCRPLCHSKSYYVTSFTIYIELHSKLPPFHVFSVRC